MAPNITNNGNVPELLYHIKRTVIDFATDESGATQTTDILSTYIDLAAAKKAAHSALLSEGYLPEDDFETYEVNDGSKAAKWEHGDGVIVFAKAPAGQVFEVRLDTKSNVLHFKGNAGTSKVEDYLHYILQTTILYDSDSTGRIQTTEVEGTYPTRKSAFEAAKNVLLDEDITKESFAEYDEQDLEKGEWPYGDEVLVHAVAETGENVEVLVKAQPHGKQLHKCKHHGGKNGGVKVQV